MNTQPQTYAQMTERFYALNQQGDAASMGHDHSRAIELWDQADAIWQDRCETYPEEADADFNTVPF